MKHQKRNISTKSLDGTKSPAKDKALASRQASQFPTTGVTLPNYQYDPRDKRRKSPGVKVKKSRFSRIRSKLTLKRSILSILALILIVGGFLGFKFVYNLHKIFGGSVLSIFSTTKLRGEDQGRVNILLAGNSADDPGHDGANLTDSIMIISINTKNNTAWLLSIPRDLYVSVPGSGYQKINQAYVDGQTGGFNKAGYFPGGMGQLQQVITQDFGINLNYYALIDYSGIRDAVNAVGGITINIKSNDPRGLYDPSIDYTTHGPLVKLTNGPHKLDGQQALDLARARGDAYGSYGFDASDFERTANQREMLVALKNKITTVGVFANPIKLTDLVDAFGSSVHTDFKLGEVHRLYDLTNKIPSSKIASLSLNNVNGQDLLGNYTTNSGEDALVPAAGINNYSQIQDFILKETSTNPVVQEGAKVEVLNGTNVTGLAAKVEQSLDGQHVDVTGAADASIDSQATTQIIETSPTTATKFPATTKLLEDTFGKTNVTTVNPYSGVYTDDFIIVVGNDQANQTDTQTP